MVYSSVQWNITKSEGLELIHESIRKILRENDCKILLNELVEKLSKINVNIHNTKKYNDLVKYIKCNYRGIKKFLDDFNIYGLSTYRNNITVYLLDDNGHIYNRITRDDEWVIL